MRRSSWQLKRRRGEGGQSGWDGIRWLVVFAMQCAAGSAGAQTSGGFSFIGAGSFGRTNPFTYNGAALHNCTVSSMTRNGILSYGWTNCYLSNDWPIGGTDTPGAFNTPAQLTGSIDPNKYIQFSITAASGHTFSNPKVGFNLWRFDQAPHQWVWRSSLDNYTSNIDITTVGGGSNVSYSNGVISIRDVANNVFLSGFEFELPASNLSSITFRLYGYNAEVGVPYNAQGAMTAQGTAGFQTGITVSVSDSYTGGGWSLGTGPAAGDNVFIEDDLVVAPGTAWDFGSLKVAASKSITINSSSSGYGQLKIRGTLNNLGTVVHHQYVGASGHHAVASSMSDGFALTSGSSSSLYSYDAALGAWNMSPATTGAGVGYFAPVQASGGFAASGGTFSVTGTPNTSHTHSLGYASTVASGGSGNGWNLVGNPYTCALDWTAVTKSSGVNNAFYIWNPATLTYDYYVSGVTAPTGTYAGSSITSPYIAPLQAFWVQTTSAGQTLTSTMAAAGTVAASPSYYCKIRVKLYHSFRGKLYHGVRGKLYHCFRASWATNSAANCTTC